MTLPSSRHVSGRLRLLNRCVSTDGRRFDQWGNAKATLIHFVIGMSWYLGASGSQLQGIYNRLYGDIR